MHTQSVGYPKRHREPQGGYMYTSEKEGTIFTFMFAISMDWPEVLDLFLEDIAFHS